MLREKKADGEFSSIYFYLFMYFFLFSKGQATSCIGGHGPGVIDTL